MAEREIVEESRRRTSFMRFYRGCRVKERDEKGVCRKEASG